MRAMLDEFWSCYFRCAHTNQTALAILRHYLLVLRPLLVSRGSVQVQAFLAVHSPLKALMVDN